MKSIALHLRPNTRAATFRGLVLACGLGLIGLHPLQGEEAKRDGSDRSAFQTETGSDSPDEENFASLIGNSPFLRRLDLSRSLVLTGVAEIEGTPFAILHDREKDESHFVTGNKNPQGWRLLGIDGNPEEMETVMARISVAGGEVISIGYDPKQLRAEPGVGLAVPRDQMKSVLDEARNYRRGLSADGFPRLPPPDLMEKLGKMSESQRGRIIYQMRQLREKGVGGTERQKIFRGLVDRSVPGKR